MDCVIIGGGVAGFAAAKAIRSSWPDKSVVLMDSENEVGYYRTLLPQYMSETLTEKKLFFRTPQDDPQLIVKTGCRVRSLDRLMKRVILESDEAIGYERLILAVGGRPIIPPIFKNTFLKGIYPVRYLFDARPVRKAISGHPHIVILGGGLVGVKTAAHFAHTGLEVTVVERENRLLPMALSKRASKPVEAHLDRLGIRLKLGCSVNDLKSEKEQLCAVLAGEEWIDCQMLLLAAGSVPDIEFIEDSGLLEDGKLLVSSALQTLDENIFALGDAVTIKNGGPHTPWTWPQAVSQGKHAAANLFRSPPVPIQVTTRVNAMNLFGLSLIVLGAPVSGAKVVSYSNPADGVYRELFIVDDRIIGGALVGDITDAGPLHAMMIAGEKIDPQNLEHIKPRGTAFSKRSWSDLVQYRRAFIMPVEEFRE